MTRCFRYFTHDMPPDRGQACLSLGLVSSQRNVKWRCSGEGSVESVNADGVGADEVWIDFSFFCFELENPEFLDLNHLITASLYYEEH
jgi:hypothetical protein